MKTNQKIDSVNEECPFKIKGGAPVLVGALTDSNLVSQLR